MVIVQLLDWIQWHFTEGDRYAKESLESDSPESHPNYWNAVTIYILQGRVSDARKLLYLHSSSQSESFQQMDQLLKKMPLFINHTGKSIAEFEFKWKHWQEECKYKMQEAVFFTVKPLEQVCRILCGDKQAFSDIMDLCETWYHMLVSRLFYTNPTIKPLEIQNMAEECLEMYGILPKPTQLDSILLAALEYDPFRVIRESSLCFDTWWFAAHLMDMLHHCDKMNSEQMSYGVTLREFLLLDYVASLMSHDSLWQIGANYLDHCPMYGKQHLELYLERVPLKNQSTALKILHIAGQKELPTLAHTVCRAMGMQALRNSNLGTAMTWALKSKDSVFSAYLADTFLREYSEKGHFSNLDLLDNLGSSMVVSDRLTFLAKYREFHRLYEVSDFKNAAVLLTSLLASRLAPKYFWLTLLLDALPLLESDELVFSSEQTYELMYCLEVLQEEQKIGKSQTIYSTEDKKEMLRLGLARNLTRAIISEGTEP